MCHISNIYNCYRPTLHALAIHRDQCMGAPAAFGSGQPATTMASDDEHAPLQEDPPLTLFFFLLNNRNGSSRVEPQVSL